MTKYFLRLILLVAAIIGVLLLIEAMLPRGYDFERSISIDRSPEVVFGQLNSLKNWPKWSKQFNVHEIEQLQIKYSGTEEGVGAAQTWTERRGTGKLWITESQANEMIVYESEFASFPKMTGIFKLSSAGEKQTTISWRHHGRLPQTPLYGLMSGVFSSQMGYEYEKSLASLKSFLETDN